MNDEAKESEFRTKLHALCREYGMALFTDEDVTEIQYASDEFIEEIASLPLPSAEAERRRKEFEQRQTIEIIRQEIAARQSAFVDAHNRRVNGLD